MAWRRRYAGGLLAAALALAAAAPAADWPHWRGPTRNGLTPEPSGWKAGAPWPGGKPAWSAEVGEGATSPLVVKGRLYTLGHVKGKDHVVCLDAASGKELWKASYPCPRYGRHHVGDEDYYGGPCSTPEYDAATGYLYTLSIDGDLRCWDASRSGREVWGFNLYARYGAGRRPKVGTGGRQRDYGYTSSPLVHGDWLLVEVGGKDGTVMAFDKRGGTRRWVSACKELAGHTGGMAPLTVEGVPCVAALTLTHLVVLRLDKGREGETVTRYPWATEFANNVASPTAAGSEVLLTSAYNRNALCKLTVTLKGATKAWEVPYPSKACSPVVFKGHVYLAWRKLHCLDLKTGKLRWSGGVFGDPGSVVATTDGRLVVWGGFGRLALVESAGRSPDEYKELARLDRVFSAHVWPHVALAGGRLYCKDRRGNVKCYALKGGG